MVAGGVEGIVVVVAGDNDVVAGGTTISSGGTAVRSDVGFASGRLTVPFAASGRRVAWSPDSACALPHAPI